MSLKLFLATSDEPFYLPGMAENIVRLCRHNIVGIILLSPVPRNSSWFKMARQFYNLYGPWHFIRTSFSFALFKMLDRVSYPLQSKRFFSVKSAAKIFNIPLYTPENINAKNFLAILRRQEPDLIVSLSASQIFGRSLLDLPKYGVINVHGAPLPKYRGLMPSFWMLANGEKQAAVTVHFMDEKLDSGDVIKQRFFDILPDDTQHSLILRSKRIGAELLLEVLDLFEEMRGNVPRLPNPESQATYFGFPTKKDVDRFRKLGRRFR